MLYVVSLLSLLIALQQVYALPNGAPVCTINGPAPGGIHLQRGAALTFTGTLALAGFNVTFDGVDISTLSSIEVNTSTPVKVAVIANGVPLKGVLVIVSRPFTDVSGAFTLSAEEAAMLQISQICRIESGVTHVDESFKTKTSATLTIDEAYPDLKLDVNVVVQNNETGSLYYYSQYTFASIAPAAAPTGGGTGGGCGVFGLGILCPFSFCGFFGRLILGDRDC